LLTAGWKIPIIRAASPTPLVAITLRSASISASVRRDWRRTSVGP
jgi:hypothetical protein